MEDRQARRQAQKKRQQRQAAGCFSLIVLVVVLLGGYVILRVLGGPGAPNWTSALTENPYAPADFATVNGYVTCTAGPTRLLQIIRPSPASGRPPGTFPLPFGNSGKNSLPRRTPGSGQSGTWTCPFPAADTYFPQSFGKAYN